MGPKKDKVWKDNFRDLLHEYNIIFEGPVKPEKWPQNHRHSFGVIRDIWMVRHAEYLRSEKLTQRAIFNRRREAEDIAKRAHRARYGRRNEESWRSLEADLMLAFRKEAICGHCKNELRLTEHEALPLADDAVIKLERKRQHRRACRCSDQQNGGSAITASEEADTDPPVIFGEFHSMSITHHPTDFLEHTDIPMKPDRTVGLSVSHQWHLALRFASSDLTHFPIRRTTDVLYPFLLVEAKKGEDNPGFVAIEAQTAFPIRRLVLQQDSLYKKAGTEFDPLVWFFAYQGEEWRLYAGTLRDHKVRVYDLWHGTVESADGALQLLQIIDYLWSWGRDVYRPQIRDSLYALAPTLRSITPLTESSLSRSQSVLSDRTLGTAARSQLDTVMENHETVERCTSDTELFTEPISDHLLSQYGKERPNLELHNFARAELRHSDTVKFSFRLLNFPIYADLFQDSSYKQEDLMTAITSGSLLQSEPMFILEQRQIQEVALFWLGRQITATSILSPDDMSQERKVTCFHFRTFCSKADWQIVRELTCITWNFADLQQNGAVEMQNTLSAAQDGTENVDVYIALLSSLLTLREMTGRTSVFGAMSATKLTLSRQPISGQHKIPMRWTPGYSTNVEDFEEKLASSSISMPPFYHTSAEISVLERRISEGEDIGALIRMPEAVDNKGGILIKKPPSWPAESPKFCLFVLTDIEASDKSGLRSLLSHVVTENPVRIHQVPDRDSESRNVDFNSAERLLIREWMAAYKD